MLNNTKFHYRQCGRARVKKKNAFMTRYLFSFKIYINAVLKKGRGSVVGVPTTLQNTAVRIPVGTGDIISKTSRSALGPYQPSIYWSLEGGWGGVLSRNKMAEVWRPLTPIYSCSWDSQSYNCTHHRPSERRGTTVGGALLLGAKDCPTCTCRLKTSTIPTSMRWASALYECFQCR